MELQGVSYRVDTVEHYVAGPAMKYSRLAVSSDDNTFGASVLEINMNAANRPMIKVEVGHDSINTTEAISELAMRKSDSIRRYVAAMNGDFFITSSFAATHPLGKRILGFPNVTSATGGRIISPDAIDYPNREKCFILTDDGNMYIDATDISVSIIDRSGQSILLTQINYPRTDNDIILYNSFFGRHTKTDSTGLEIILEPATGKNNTINRPMKYRVVQPLAYSGNSKIPADGAIISIGRNRIKDTPGLTQLKPGDEITVNINLSLPAHDNLKPENISEIIGGDVRVLNQGRTTKAGDPDALRFINSATMKYQRSLVGFSKDCSELVFCSVDNGIGGGGVSYYDAGDLMRELGCYDALDLDGGGSTAMYLRTPGIVNHLRDGAERAVGNGLFAVVEAPEDNKISTIRFADHAIRVAKSTEYRPIFYGYNSHDELISMNVEGVHLSAPSELGCVTPDGTLMVTGQGAHPLTATYNGSTATIIVTIDNDI